ncbi:MAG TPA: mandelate racemase/muconate lactonizing enzyme family protein [Tepidisphaeraceae bacterium]|jgi:L-alanine-DL-glutamate epimerase-like enolase superfamily enzyme|nr:mandelate racemase/muconate lactonizing enzyme family protein [Tepidisphaeraceae bacterium]
MKIVDLDFALLSSPYCQPERWRSYGVAVVRTEDGRVGVGEPYAGVNLPVVCREAVTALRPLFIDQDATQIDALMKHAHATVEYFDHRGLVCCVLGAIDWGLHDLASQRAGLPMHRFLNPCSAAGIELYASTGVIGWSIAETVNEIHRRIAEGYRCIKIRVGCGQRDADEAIARTEAIVNAANGRARIAVDAGQQVFLRKFWTFSDALRVMSALGAMGICFLEDPYLITDRQAYRRLRDVGGAPIAGGEMFNRAEEFDSYFSAGALDVAQPDASVLPGPAASLRVAEAARKHGVRLIMHGWAGPIAQLQNIHIALAAGNCEMVEYCPLLHPLLVDGLAPVWRFADGRLEAPTAPGIGAAAIDDLLLRYPFKENQSLIA